MATDRFLIGYADNQTGLQTNVKPWILPDNAYSNLYNCYVFRGRTRKRFGSIWMGTSQLNTRLAYQLDVTMNNTGTVPGIVFAIGQMFSIGNDVFTVNALGTPATLLSTNPAITFTYNTSTGDYVVTGATASSQIFFYPATPVMALTQYFIPPSNLNVNLAFDTQFAYEFDAMTNTWGALTSGTATWTGTDIDLFWTTNYIYEGTSINQLWVTNFNPADGIRYWDGSTWTTANIQTNSGGDTVLSCRLIIQFHNRLLLFNTIESVSSVTTSYVNLVRCSAVGSPTASTAWYSSPAAGQGFALYAPVAESIKTVQFIKDHLIVYFDKSTFELVYTNNQVAPFVWQQINTELGAEATFSEVPFDRQVYGFDNIGIHICNGSNVERMDEAIPQYAFDISDVNGGRERIYGIRDYYNEVVYWSYRSSIASSNVYFPNRMLIYNYVNDSWGIFQDSFTCFGYFPYSSQTPGATWGNTYTAWQDLTILWNSQADATTTPTVETVLAGNQQGYVSVLMQDMTSNASVLQITDINLSTNTITCVNHNLEFNDFVLLSTMNGLTFTDSNGNVLPTLMVMVTSNSITANSPNTFTFSALDNNLIKGQLQAVTITGTYIGGGTAARVSNVQLTTKQFNFYTSADRNCYISRVDFLVDKTSIGQVTVDFLLSSSQNSFLSEGIANGSLPGSNVLETSPYALVPFEQVQDRLWHPVYFYAEGQCIQFNTFMTPIQMFNYVINTNGTIQYTANQDFQLHAMVIYAQPTSSRMQ